MEKILHYFPELSEVQKEQFSQLQGLYTHWNEQINVVSRKDIEHLYLHHVLHSLSIAKTLSFKDFTNVLDVGTGGGFPGIPLAIMFPNAKFHLVDSIGKKVKVASEIAKAIGLQNVTTEHNRVEKLTDNYHFVVSRAVTDIFILYQWVKHLIAKTQFNDFKNGILCLKGGDLRDEFRGFRHFHRFYAIQDYFPEPYFEEKKVVYVPI